MKKWTIRISFVLLLLLVSVGVSIYFSHKLSQDESKVEDFCNNICHGLKCVDLCLNTIKKINVDKYDELVFEYKKEQKILDMWREKSVKE